MDLESGTSRDRYRPWYDLVEQDDGLQLLVDLPGVAREDLLLELRGNRLVLEGRTGYAADPFSGTDEHAHHLEFRGGDYHLELPLPEGVDAQAIAATLQDGVLAVRLPRGTGSQARRIVVDGG